MRSLYVPVCLIVAASFCFPALAEDRNQMPLPPASVNKYPVVYQVTGLRDDGAGPAAGVATTINCTNPTPFTANLQILIYNYNANLVTNQTFKLTRLQTFTASTHDTVLYVEDTDLGTGPLLQGYAQLRSDNPQLLCAAEIVDASPKKNFAVTLPARSANSGG